MPDPDIQRMKTEDIEKGFHPAETHAELLGLSVRDLRLRSGDATHQHFKGGLYRLLGPAMDARTGRQLIDHLDRPCIAYLHCYPYERQVWVRAEEEFNDQVEREGYSGPRFRRIA